MTDQVKVVSSPALELGKRYRIKGPRFNGIYCVTYVDTESGYIGASPSPRPNIIQRRGGFGYHISTLVADGHTIQEVRGGR